MNNKDRLLTEASLRPEEVHARASDLLTLQHGAYAIEAELIGDNRIPPLHEDEAGLVAAGLSWLLELKGSRIIGALGYRHVSEGYAVDIDRLIVDPGHLRKGIGSRLVLRALDICPRAQVSTGRDNAPARWLYEHLGFVHEGDVEVIPHLWVSNYTRG